MAFTLPPLPYPTNALEPHIDSTTMEIHHGKHHNAYVTNLNKALESAPELAGKSLEELLANQCAIVPEGIRTAVRNNGGGHSNHSLFWQILEPIRADSRWVSSPRPSEAPSEVSMRSRTNSQPPQWSLWLWLGLAGERRLGQVEIYSTANQDSPVMEGKKAIIGLDVWEHAYYLNYQNRRPDYVNAWWNVVNWQVAEQRFTS